MSAKTILRPLLGRLRRVLRPEIQREAVDVAKATARAAREIPEHYRDIKKERGK
jgi:hypothetical protein